MKDKSQFDRYPEVYPVESILPKIRRCAPKLLLDGDRVSVSSGRLLVYKMKGVDCVSCGAKGSFFAKERDSVSAANQDFPFHLNLYAVKNGREVMMTNDHITPKSKGGPSTIDNLQPMCEPCNRKKADK